MKNNTMKLDELEICIQLLTLDKPELKYATYATLKELIEKEFGQPVRLEDIYLLYEPTISQDQKDAEIMYGSMYNLVKYDY